MNQYKTDVRTGFQYELQGNYYMVAGEEDEKRFSESGVSGICAG